MGHSCGKSRGSSCHLVSFNVILRIFQVKNLSVAKEMIKSMAVEAQAAREANGLLIMQNGEGTCLEKIK